MSRPMNRNRLPAGHFIDVLMSLGALPRRVCGVVLVAALLGGCGGGNDPAAENPNPTAVTGTGLVATAIRQTAPASACPNGGVSVDAGIDKNANGVLDASEVTNTQHVCGNNVMVATTPEPDGANCPNSGSKVSAGLDSNSNSALDATEVTSTAYVCNSSVSPGWTSVSSGPVQTLPNQGYTALSVTTPLVLTLLANPAVNDTLHVVGAGAAGWQLAQHAGQSIVTSSLGAQAVTLASIGALWELQAVNVNSVTPGSIAKRTAASADGQRLAAVQGDSIRRSLDGGLTWANGPVLSGVNLTTVAASADGLRLVTMNSSDGIFTSVDGGVTWTSRGVVPGVSYWRAVASSADGARLVAADSSYTPEISGFLYTSSDAGVTWTQRGTARVWTDVASSADGMRLVAASSQGLYTSSDAGVTWTARETTQSWQGVASSADGAKLVATVFGGQIHTSTDAGVTWVARNAGGTTEPWGPVASSADGNRLVAATSLGNALGGGVFLSTDSGVTWTLTSASDQKNYTTLASSADGSRHVATAGSDLWTSASQADAPATTTGTGGALSGGQYSAVDLQYIGNGQWIILDHQGTLFVQ